MKFGKKLLQIRKSVRTDWTSKFIDYKALKATIKAIVKSSKRPSSFSCSDSDSGSLISEEQGEGERVGHGRRRVVADIAPYSSSALTLVGGAPSPHNSKRVTVASVLSKSEAEVVFFKTLTQEFRKVTTFFDETLADLCVNFEYSYARLQDLSREILAEQASRLRMEAGAATSLGVADRAATVDEQHQRQEYNGGRSLQLFVKLISTFASLLTAYDDMDGLDQFAVANFCGFSKILKKHDKRTGFITREPFLRNVLSKASFANSSDYDGRLKRLQECCRQSVIEARDVVLSLNGLYGLKETKSSQYISSSESTTTTATPTRTHGKGIAPSIRSKSHRCRTASFEALLQEAVRADINSSPSSYPSPSSSLQQQQDQQRGDGHTSFTLTSDQFTNSKALALKLLAYCDVAFPLPSSSPCFSYYSSLEEKREEEYEEEAENEELEEEHDEVEDDEEEEGSSGGASEEEQEDKEGGSRRQRASSSPFPAKKKSISSATTTAPFLLLRSPPLSSIMKDHHQQARNRTPNHDSHDNNCYIGRCRPHVSFADGIALITTMATAASTCSAVNSDHCGDVQDVAAITEVIRRNNDPISLCPVNEEEATSFAHDDNREGRSVSFEIHPSDSHASHADSASILLLLAKQKQREAAVALSSVCVSSRNENNELPRCVVLHEELTTNSAADEDDEDLSILSQLAVGRNGYRGEEEDDGSSGKSFLFCDLSSPLSKRRRKMSDEAYQQQEDDDMATEDRDSCSISSFYSISSLSSSSGSRSFCPCPATATATATAGSSSSASSLSAGHLPGFALGEVQDEEEDEEGRDSN